jgi:hypothetical protein
MNIYLYFYKCRRCWKFSAIASVEGQSGKATGKYLSLSKQQLVDCDTYDSGYNGGHPMDAFNYILSSPSKEINTNLAYPVRFNYFKF